MKPYQFSCHWMQPTTIHKVHSPHVSIKTFEGGLKSLHQTEDNDHTDIKVSTALTK